MQKKFLLRVSDELYEDLVSLSGEKSLNQYINDILENQILNSKGRVSKMEKVNVGNMMTKDLREAVTVTQQEWYMKILDKYKIYFFAPSRIVSPMAAILFYGDSSCEPARSISRYGRVSHIYRNVATSDLEKIPEMKELLNDSEFAKEIKSWEKFQIAVLSDVVKLENPLPLTKDYINHPRIIVNRETTIAKFLKAKKIDDLFEKDSSMVGTTL